MAGFGCMAFVRAEKLLKTVKGKGLLDSDYKADSFSSLYIGKL